MKYTKKLTALILCLIIASSVCINVSATDSTQGKHLSVSANSGARDIYSPLCISSELSGYRYGPSIIRNADGSRDIFLAAPGVRGEWDWINYMHFNKNGRNTNGEKNVLQPTPGSQDFYSTCDPGVIFFGGYYYIGYTSTINPNGIDNHVFVARSKNIDGPYEKWNGSGWGGNPQPFIRYTDNEQCFGAGEPSFVLMGDKLYIYYSWVNEQRGTGLAIADATDENWPATLQDKGVILMQNEAGSDSLDVKYIDEYNKFIAIETTQRMGEESYISIFESDNGVDFVRSSVLKTNIAWYCHNAGIEGNPQGHIENPDSVLIGYAYGKGWGAWSLRLQTVKITLADSIDLSDVNNQNVKQENKRNYFYFFSSITGITTQNSTYDVSLSDGAFRVKFKAVNRYTMQFPLWANVKISGYDSSIISVSGKKITPLKKGSTLATAQWNGHTTSFLINVN